MAEEVPWVQRAIGLAGVRGRGGKVRAPQTNAHYPDGITGVIAYTTDGPMPVVFKPRQLGLDEDGREIWEVPAEQVDKFRERVARSGRQFEIHTRRAESYEGAEVEYGVGPTNVSLWPRLAAKLTLCCASLAFDQAWLQSDGAQGLQTLFVHDLGPGYDLGVLPSELDENHALRDLLDVDEHLLWFQPRPDGGATFAVILFGAIQYALRVPDADARDQPTWLLRANKAAKSTPDVFGAVFGELIERAQKRDPNGHWAVQ
jgi:hypothetical protein